MKLSEQQIRALKDYERGLEHPDSSDYRGALWFRNRERVIDSLEKRKLIARGDDGNFEITELGRTELKRRV